MNCSAHGPASSGALFFRTYSRIAVFAVLAGLGTASARLVAESANTDYTQGQRAEAREDYDTALADYQKAFQKSPKDLRFRTAIDRVRVTASSVHMTKGRKLLQGGDLTGALSEFLHASEIDPGNEAAQQGIAKVRQQQGQAPPTPEIGLPQAAGEQEQLNSMGAPAQLKLVSNEPLTLHMTEDAKMIYQAVGKAAAINVLFDPDYTSKRVTVDLNNVTLLDALRIVGAMSNTFWRPVTANTIFVAQNTRTKRTELDEQAVQTFYLTNAWQQNDLNDVQTALRNVLPNAKVYGVASQNAIVMRGTPDELLLAEKLINDLDKARSEVVVDIGVLEVSKNWEKTLGISWPSSIGVALTNPTTANNTNNTCPAGSTTCTPTTGTGTSTTSGLSLYNLAHLNSNDFAVTVGSATVNALLTDDNTQILQDPRIRATDGQKATLTIGSKIPEATGSYAAPGIGGGAGIGIGYAQTQFQYVDVGVKVEMTPTVHFDNDVTLKIHIEVTSESGQTTIEGVTEPIISQRVVDQVNRLKEGEASILGGIEDKEEAQNWSGIPGLSSIPILKYIFGSKDHTIKDDELVFVVVPHVVRGQTLNQQNLRAIDTGEGQSIELRRVDNNSAAGPAAELHPATMDKPAVGTVPGNSAPAAVMAAMSQMRSAADAMDNPAPAQTVPPSPFAGPPPGRPSATWPANAPPAAAGSAQQAAPPPRAPVNPFLQPQANAAAAAQPGQPAATKLNFAIPPPQDPIAAGATFKVPVILSGGTDIASIPLQLSYDPAKLTLVNVSSGDYLSKDGQAVALIHRDDGPGNVTIVASRPPGTTGVSGDGTVCVLTFQAKAPGQSVVNMTRAGAVDSKQQQLPAQSVLANIMVK